MQRQSDRLPGARGRAARCLLLLWIILLIGGSREEKSWAQAGNREEVALYTFAVRAYQDGLYDLAKQQFQQYLTRFPQGARRGEVQFYLGELAFQAKQYEQAVQYYRQALPTLPDPVRTPARFKLGKLLYQLRRYPEVIEVLAPLRDQPGRWQEEALYWSGEAALKGGKLSEALPFWEQLLQAFPQGNYAAYAYYARGWIRQQQGKYALALQDFQKIEVLFPQSPLLLPAQLAMAHLLLTLERYGEAEEKFRWILEQDREERYQEEALFGWAESLLHARRYAEAVTAYERYRSTFPQGRWSETVLYNLGRAYYVQKEFAKAVELFREVRERFPQSTYLPDLLLMQARSYRALQQPQKAVQAYTEFLATAPQGQMRFLALSERGMLFYRLHRLDQARADFSQLRTPKAPAELQTLAEYMLGEIAFQGKEYEAALSHYLAVSQYPDTPAEVWYKLGYAYAVRKQYPPAVKALEKYLTFPLEQADRKRGLALLIRVLLRQGDYEKAIARYQMRIQEFPQDKETPTLVQELVDLFLQLQRPAEAIATYERWLQQAPPHPRQEEMTLKLAFLYQQQGEEERAIQTLQTLTRQAKQIPVRAEAFYRLADLYAGQGERQKALQVLQEMQAALPQAGEWQRLASYRAGVLYEEEQDWAAAVAAYAAVLRGEGGDETLKQAAAERLEKLKPLVAEKPAQQKVPQEKQGQP